MIGEVVRLAGLQRPMEPPTLVVAEMITILAPPLPDVGSSDGNTGAIPRSGRSFPARGAVTIVALDPSTWVFAVMIISPGDFGPAVHQVKWL
jgi:hypothetical protein